MVGFNNIITFNNNGKVTDYQRAYNKEYGKTLKVFLPLNFNNKKDYIAKLTVAINNTYPKEIKIVEGIKSETDLNCYEFDLTQLFYKLVKKQIGLCRVCLVTDKGRVRFESESFRV